MSVIFLRPEQLGKAMDETAREAVPLLITEFHAGLHQALRAEVRRVTPVKQSQGSRPSGVLKKSLASVLGDRKSVLRAGVRAAILKARPGTKSLVVLRAPHAIVIGQGLAIAKSGPQAGKRIGSPQAPRGIPEPALEALEPRAPEIFARAQRKAEVVVDGR